MYIVANLLGRLNWHVFPKDMITLGGFVSMIMLVVVLFLFITYKKKWKWLWKEWFTSVDPKKIGVMYIVVAIAMLLRGIADVLMIRAQQATSVGASHGFLSANTFQQVFSAHGTIMIFFVGMGFMFGLINLVLPLQIGA